MRLESLCTLHCAADELWRRHKLVLAWHQLESLESLPIDICAHKHRRETNRKSKLGQHMHGWRFEFGGGVVARACAQQKNKNNTERTTNKNASFFSWIWTRCWQWCRVACTLRAALRVGAGGLCCALSAALRAVGVAVASTAGLANNSAVSAVSRHSFAPL